MLHEAPEAVTITPAEKVCSQLVTQAVNSLGDLSALCPGGKSISEPHELRFDQGDIYASKSNPSEKTQTVASMKTGNESSPNVLEFGKAPEPAGPKQDGRAETADERKVQELAGNRAAHAMEEFKASRDETISSKDLQRVREDSGEEAVGKMRLSEVDAGNAAVKAELKHEQAIGEKADPKVLEQVRHEAELKEGQRYLKNMEENQQVDSKVEQIAADKAVHNVEEIYKRIGRTATPEALEHVREVAGWKALGKLNSAELTAGEKAEAAEQKNEASHGQKADPEKLAQVRKDAERSEGEQYLHNLEHQVQQAPTKTAEQRVEELAGNRAVHNFEQTHKGPVSAQEIEGVRENAAQSAVQGLHLFEEAQVAKNIATEERVLGPLPANELEDARQASEQQAAEDYIKVLERK